MDFLYFIGGIIAGLLINNREAVAGKINREVAKIGIDNKVQFIEPESPREKVDKIFKKQ